ncbi:hypothetical protein BC936DRAFT_145344 [Jimgerdemannia flammicorona]|uniref:Uncharacterized protein n=1 Tax=Jimgerdemannia flammicorona TaxID=994334 RepID=A0A433DA97_9FUNG|nr:hypothetical protein BC936DRAFT_145344 [Jimgerdemannia flammicorona]
MQAKVEKIGHSKKRNDGNDEHEEGTVKRVRIHGVSHQLALGLNDGFQLLRLDQSDTESDQYLSDSEQDSDSQHNEQGEDGEEIDDVVDPNDAIPGDDVPGSGELERQENMTYPADISSPDIWRLPSGLSVAEAIRPPPSLPKVHPSHMGIIRIGVNIRRPKWIQRADWNYLQSSVVVGIDPPSEHIQDFFKTLCETECLEEYAEVIKAARTKRTNDKQLAFYLDVLEWFATTVFIPVSTFNSPRAQESALGSLLLHPVLRYLANVSSAHYIPYVL